LLFYDRLSRKPLLFKSFIGLSVKQFDDVYDEIKSKYTKFEIKRLSYRNDRKRSIGGGRDISNWMLRIGLSWFWCTTGFISLVLLQVYSLIWIRVTFAEIFKRLRN
jgi:hypothetical protein